MGSYVVDLREADGTQVPTVGGKGASLGELGRIDGVRVPHGFCVSTEAYRRVLRETPTTDDLLDRLDRLRPDDGAGIRSVSAEARRTLEGTAVPAEVDAAIRAGLERHGRGAAYAVRSSATAEDSPTASLAGQHDTELDVVGPEAVLRAVRRCWASVFSERAVSYRLRRGMGHRDALMAVVVQRMVLPRASGVCFTADPVSGDRTVVCVESGPGLGEALVSGLVDPDVHVVRRGEVIRRTVARERNAIRLPPPGGVRRRSDGGRERDEPVLSDAQVVRLARIGRRIEAHFGVPQDLEWCLADDVFQIVQSRPITTLYPVPEADDDAPHVYVSVGHQQMMTDPMRTLGLSVHRTVAIPRMVDAGGRLFVDVAGMLASPTRRAALLGLWKADPLTGGALRTLADRGFVPTVPDAETDGARAVGLSASDDPAPATDPAVVAELVARTERSLAVLERDIQEVHGPALVPFIQEDGLELKRLLTDPQSLPVIRAAMDATAWLNESIATWLGETNVADTLTLSAPGNVTSEMGLALLDVADVLRPHPAVVAFLDGVDDDGFLDRMDRLDGGPEVRDAIRAYLDRYGMRCVGEIDVTRPRWDERPSTLLPLLLANVRTFGPGESRRRVDRGEREARAKEQELLARLRDLPGGEEQARETERMVRRVRTFIGYREFPKYGMVRRYAIWKRALMAEAARLVRDGVLATEEDVFHLTLDEIHDVLRTNDVDVDLISRRARAHRAFADLTPPRVITSDGEVVTGSYARDDVPEGALTGLAVSRGTVEGRARVVLDMADADLEAGDVLVTAYTDPSWSPLFVAAAALVTEVGGLMTHGAVVAREYGLPAVVGVEGATRLIEDGRRIRVHGTDGYVELLP